jgi:hypothetical protein
MISDRDDLDQLREYLAEFTARGARDRLVLIVALLALVISIASIIWQAYQSVQIDRIESRLNKIQGPPDPTVIPPPAQ